MLTVPSIIKQNLIGVRSFSTLQVLYGLCALAVFFRLGLFVVFEPFFEGDTDILVKSNSTAIRACLKEGRFSGCVGAGSWPLLQHVPSFILRSLDFPTSAVLHFLAYLSFFAFAGSVLLIFLALQKKASLALAATTVLVMISGPLLWYSHSTFGEMVATFLTLAFTSAVLFRRPGWLLALLLVLAGSTKEIAAPFLLLMGLVGLLPELIVRPKAVSSRALGVVVGAILSVTLNAAFNYFRFAKFYNVAYAAPIAYVPTWKLQLNFFMGLWFSPNGGLAVFWTSFVFIFFALLVLLLFRVVRKRSGKPLEAWERLCFYIPIASVSLILFLLTMGFSKWYAPFGWLAWGPRLMVSWIPALLLLLLHFYSSEVEAILRLILRKPWTLVLTSTILVLVSLPQFMILFGSFVMGDIFAPTPDCPRRPVIQENVPYYYHCLKSIVWPEKITLLKAYPVATEFSVLWFAIFYCVTLVGAAQFVRKQLIETPLKEKG